MMARQWRADRLMDKGYRALKEFDAEAALRVARKLHRLRHTSGFEIEAKALEMMDRTPEAIAVLERGVDIAPDIWILWLTLGNYLCDEGQQHMAMEAFGRALECREVDADIVQLNRAITLIKMDAPVQALEALDEIREDPVSMWRAHGVRVLALRELARFDEAVRHGERSLELVEPEEVTDEDRARLISEISIAVWKGFKNKERALEYAWKAISLNKANDVAMWVIRDVASEYSEHARHFTLLIRGDWTVADSEASPDEPGGFFCKYGVVADTPEEGLEYVRPFEPLEVRHTLTINSVEEEEPGPDVPKGVYYNLGSYVFMRLAKPGGIWGQLKYRVFGPVFRSGGP